MSKKNARAIFEAVHGEQGTSVPGLAPIRVAQHDPRHRPEWDYDDDDDEDLGEGWSRPSVAVDAELFFGRPKEGQ